MIIKISKIREDLYEIKNPDIDCIAKTAKNKEFDKETFPEKCIITGKGARIYKEQIRNGIRKYLSQTINNEPMYIRISYKINNYKESIKTLILNTFHDIKYMKNNNIRIKQKQIYNKKKYFKEKVLKYINIDFADDLLNDLSYIRNIKDLYLNYWGISNYLNDKTFKCSDTEVKLDLLIDRVAQIEACNYEIYINSHKNESINIQDFLTYRECVNDLYKKDIVYVIKTTYMNLSIKNNLCKILKNNPKDEYPNARALKRNFHIHVGETNSGKTYDSLQALERANTGVYLAPLRLLALEIQDKLNNKGILCSLSTGEEEDIIEGATHISSTVEKANLNKYYEVCVIDECQLISDPQRGYAWTQAILGIQAKDIYLCVAPEGLSILIDIIEDCKDNYEVINHVRNTELIIEKESFSLENVKPGDALVCFSKKKVLGISAKLMEKGIKTSIIYGGLPYHTRKAQFERFLNGETNVVVCTDAIGMGLNLPIRRVVFMEIDKFDGEKVRSLLATEIKQIAGRAGRRGIYNEGFVNACGDKSYIKNSLYETIPQIKKAILGFNPNILNINADIIDILKAWKSLKPINKYTKMSISRTIHLIEDLRFLFDIEKLEYSKEMLLKMATIPFSDDNERLFELWKSYCLNFAKGKKVLSKPILSSDNLDIMEEYYKMLDLYYSFSKNFDLKIDLDWLNQTKTEIANKINNILVNQTIKQGRKCTCCGKSLPWDFPYGLCNSCFEKKNYFNFI